MKKSGSRHIDVSRARTTQRKPAGKNAAAQSSGSARRSSSEAARGAQKSSAQGRSQTASRNAAAPVRRNAKKQKVSTGKMALRVIAIVLAVLLLLLGVLYIYLSQKLNSGNKSVTNDTLTVETPPELTNDQMNILVLGLDYTESDGVERSKENPQADMILYVQFDQKAKTIRMLQIPRDSYVGDAFGSGGTGKINATFSHGSDKDNKVQNVVEVINSMFQLQVDHWITIEMESLREMVDIFGGGAGIPINIPYDIIEYDDAGNITSALYAGERILHGPELEFFLRARKAEGMNRGDIDRLDNQKIFYSALFNYMKSMSWQEMVKLMPFFLNYVETDINPLQCAALGVGVLGVPNENIVMGRLPVILNQGAYYGASQVVPVAIPETAACLNQYFRPAQAPVDVSALKIPMLNGITSPVVDCEMKGIGDNGTVSDSVNDTAGDTADPDVQPAA